MTHEEKAYDYDKSQKEILEWSVRLHNWYLEAVCNLSEEHFNKKAQKSFEELSEEQREIDRFIAVRVIDALASAEKKGLEEGRKEPKFLEHGSYDIGYEDGNKDGWNEAISSAVNEVEMEVICPQEREIRKRIANKLKGLTKNE